MLTLVRAVTLKFKNWYDSFQIFVILFLYVMKLLICNVKCFDLNEAIITQCS